MGRGGFRRASAARRTPWPAHGGGQSRRWLMVALLCGLVLFQALLAGGRAPRFTFARPTAPQVYGADDARMQNAVNTAGWPQQGHNWCGVATVAAIADYLGAGVSQGGVAGWMDSGAAVSQWGTPSFIYPGPGFPADIARDAGTDPRSLAAGLAAMAGGRYHALADPWGAWDATYRLAADIEYSGQPISVIVDHGLHSVVVSKVYANGDPAANPGSIYALEVWDPGVGSFNAQIQPYQHMQVSLGDWLYDEVYWGDPYFQNGNWDPDPAVGPYAYDPSQGLYNQVWIGNWVYIQPWGPNVSVDWTVNALDWVVPGQHGELPPGYALPTPTPVPGRDARSAPTLPVVAPSPTPVRRAFAPPSTGALATPTPYGGAPPDVIGQPLVAPSPGLAWCLGPYCLTAIDPLWLGTSAGLAVLALLLLAGAIWTRRRARHRVAGDPAPGRAPRALRGAPRPGVAAGRVTVTEVASESALAAPATPALNVPAAAPRLVPVLDPAPSMRAPAAAPSGVVDAPDAATEAVAVS